MYVVTYQCQALRQMDGYLRITFERWRAVLLTCLAHNEAAIDFGTIYNHVRMDYLTIYILLTCQVMMIVRKMWIQVTG